MAGGVPMLLVCLEPTQATQDGWIGLGIVLAFTMLNGWAWVGYLLGVRGHPSEGIRQETTVPVRGPSYSGGGDLDCEDVGREIVIRGSDPNGLDGDGDGIGCEGW